MSTFPPPLVPGPITVPGCAAEEPYDKRITFIKRVAILSALSLLVMAGSVYAWYLDGRALAASPAFLGLVSGGLLILIVLVRRASLFVQLAVFVPFFLVGSAALASLSGDLLSRQDGLYQVAVALYFGLLTGKLVYAALCGRDYTHVGSFVLTSGWLILIGTSAKFAFGCPGLTATWLTVLAIGANLYWHYDLAMILRRRLIREEMSSVIDLYRDVLNWISYPVRVVKYQRERPKVHLRW